MALVVIAGGTLDGIELALEARRAGHQVVLLTPTTYVGDDLTRTWSSYGIKRQAQALERLQKMGLVEDKKGQPAELLLPGLTKRFLLDLLVKAGVRIKFHTFLAGLALTGKQVSGALLANKHGILQTRADLVVDASLYRSAAWSLAGQELILPRGREISYTLEYFGLRETGLPDPDQAVELTPGGARPDQAYVTVRRQLPYPMPLNQAQRYIRLEAKEAAWQLRQEPAFSTAYLAGALPDAAWLEPLPPPRLELDGFMVAGQDSQLPESLTQDPAPVLTSDYLVHGQKIAARLVGLAPFPDPASGLDLEQVSLPLPEMDLPRQKSDLFVAGGGTAGVCAADAAGQRGLKVSLVELLGNLGGTRTVGGVSYFYHGNRNMLFQSILDRIKEYTGQLSADVPGQQTIAAESFFYEETFAGQKSHVFTSSVACAMAKTGRELSGVLHVGEAGLVWHEAAVFVDATGDADLAALAGVPFAYGDPRHSYTQNYSQLYRKSNSRYDSDTVTAVDQGVIDIRYPSEWQRAVIANTLQAPDYDFVEMLTVRESRRIRGRKTVTLQDVYRKTKFSDRLCSATSDYDPHSRCFTAVGRLGLLPQHAPVQWVDIPLAALQPEELDNMLVIAKAISLDQDAFNYTRMNSDIMTLGAIAGHLVARSLKEKLPLAGLDLADDQVQWQKLGVIQEKAPADLASLIPAKLAKRLAAGDEEAFTDAVLTSWPELEQLLLDILDDLAEGEDELVLRTLLWYGHTPRLRQTLARLDRLVEKSRGEFYPDRNPDRNNYLKAGILGEIDDYWRLNQLLILLARAGVTELIPRLARLASQTEAGGPPENLATEYLKTRIDNQTIPHYDRILNLAEAALLLPDNQLAQPLTELLGRPYLTGYSIRREENKLANFHMALLELKLAQAAAVCGSAKGLEIVRQYTEDMHQSLARSASEFLAGQIKTIKE